MSKHLKEIEQKIIDFISAKELISPKEKILLTLSGGADSVFMLSFFKKFQKKFKIELVALHVNHKLRGKNSDKDEMFCKVLCEKNEIPFYSFSVDVNKTSKLLKISLEEAGRFVRYNIFSKALFELKFDKIATAHNKNDNTETVLFNMIKGTGIKGLCGIPIKRDKIIRPILCLTKDEILHYLKENKIKFREDSSNKDELFKRNYLRLKILPQLRKNINPALDENIFSLTQILSEVNDVYKKKLNDYQNQIEKEEARISFDIDKISFGDLVMTDVIRNTILNKFNLEINFKKSIKILNLRTNQKGKEIQIDKNISAIREADKIIIYKKQKRLVEESFIEVDSERLIDEQKISIRRVDKKEVKINSNAKIEFIDADKVKSNLKIRRWQKGDFFYPLGMNGKKKISDYLTNCKIDSSKKKNQIVLLHEEKIVWLVGRRLDNRFKITNDTKNILKLEIS
ncbi:MAG: tRNA lysidine(34) synthetase TilS [Chlorobiaceae bacterium]|nr:tRNA lysidine(34) synthetase TilS [Chlorobiaceae bacterium]MBA4309267.1 tRNA lysidine(34) synthetase TilS [Chlorobiaceae bacterium]